MLVFSLDWRVAFWGVAVLPGVPTVVNPAGVAAQNAVSSRPLTITSGSSPAARSSRSASAAEPAPPAVPEPAATTRSRPVPACRGSPYRSVWKLVRLIRSQP